MPSADMRRQGGVVEKSAARCTGEIIPPNPWRIIMSAVHAGSPTPQSQGFLIFMAEIRAIRLFWESFSDPCLAVITDAWPRRAGPRVGRWTENKLQTDSERDILGPIHGYLS